MGHLEALRFLRWSKQQNRGKQHWREGQPGGARGRRKRKEEGDEKKKREAREEEGRENIGGVGHEERGEKSIGREKQPFSLL